MTLANTPPEYFRAYLSTGEVQQVWPFSQKTAIRAADKGLLQSIRLPGTRDRRICAASLYELMVNEGIPVDALVKMMEKRKPRKTLGINPKTKVLSTGQLGVVFDTSTQTAIRAFEKETIKGFHVPNSKFRRFAVEEVIKYMRKENVPLQLLHMQYEPHVAGLMTDDEAAALSKELGGDAENDEDDVSLLLNSDTPEELIQNVTRLRCHSVIASREGLEQAGMNVKSLTKTMQKAFDGSIPIGIWQAPEEDIGNDAIDFMLNAKDPTAAAIELRRLMCWKTLMTPEPQRNGVLLQEMHA